MCFGFVSGFLNSLFEPHKRIWPNPFFISFSCFLFSCWDVIFFGNGHFLCPKLNFTGSQARANFGEFLSLWQKRNVRSNSRAVWFLQSRTAGGHKQVSTDGNTQRWATLGFEGHLISKYYKTVVHLDQASSADWRLQKHGGCENAEQPLRLNVVHL